MRNLTSKQRSLNMNLVFDPIFINQRKVHTVFGDRLTRLVDILVSGIPPQTPEWQRVTRVHHAYSRAVLDICSRLDVPSLGSLLASEEVRPGRLFCSVETLEGREDVYSSSQLLVPIRPKFETNYTITLGLSTANITCDTGRLNLSKPFDLGVIAQVESVDGEHIMCRPLVIGAPTLSPDQKDVDFDYEWYGWDYFENFPEDIDELAEISNIPMDIDWSDMKNVPEAAIKAFLCERLGENAQNDWGGEQSDIYSASLHLCGRRTPAAFLLKGPAKFRLMTMAHLGKNGDQIYRLANEPAQLLIVQHSHEISEAVRATLRAFAVQPGRPRRYCLIDGRDTYRLLIAYGWLQKAMNFAK